MVTAQTFVQRFYYRQSLTEYDAHQGEAPPTFKFAWALVGHHEPLAPSLPHSRPLKLPFMLGVLNSLASPRLWCAVSLVSLVFNVFCAAVAMASLFLACKVEEVPRRSLDVVNVFHRCRERRIAEADAGAYDDDDDDEAGAQELW